MKLLAWALAVLAPLIALLHAGAPVHYYLGASLMR
jgi:hypothetical protein